MLISVGDENIGGLSCTETFSAQPHRGAVSPAPAWARLARQAFTKIATSCV